MALSNISFSLILDPGVSEMQFDIRSNISPARVAEVSRSGMVREEVCL